MGRKKVCIVDVASLTHAESMKMDCEMILMLKKQQEHYDFIFIVEKNESSGKKKTPVWVKSNFDECTAVSFDKTKKEEHSAMLCERKVNPAYAYFISGHEDVCSVARKIGIGQVKQYMADDVFRVVTTEADMTKFAHTMQPR